MSVPMITMIIWNMINSVSDTCGTANSHLDTLIVVVSCVG